MNYVNGFINTVISFAPCLKSILQGLRDGDICLHSLSDDEFYKLVEQTQEVLRVPEQKTTLDTDDILKIVLFRRDFLNFLASTHHAYHHVMMGVIFLHYPYPTHDCVEYHDLGVPVPDSVVLGTALLEFMGAK